MKSNNQYKETVNAVIGHTALAARMKDAGMDFDMGGNLGTELALYDYAQKTGNWGVFEQYADANYDSSGDYWKLIQHDNGTYEMINDGRDDVTVVNEKGKVIREYKYGGGDKAEFLSGVLGISASEVKDQMSTAGWNLNGNQWQSASNGTIRFGTDMSIKLSNAAVTNWNIPGLFPTLQSVNVVDNFGVNSALAALASTYNVLASSGNIMLNGLGAVNELKERGIDFLDENIPSQLTGTGSVRRDIDVLAFAIPVLNVEVSLASQTIGMIPSYLKVKDIPVVKYLPEIKSGTVLPSSNVVDDWNSFLGSNQTLINPVTNRVILIEFFC